MSRDLIELRRIADDAIGGMRLASLRDFVVSGYTTGETEDIREALQQWASAFDAALSASEARNRSLEEALKVCQQSLKEQALARHDPTMPLLTPEVLETLKGDAEANYACADTADERIAAHGLSLLCDWQDRARALQTPQAHHE